MATSSSSSSSISSAEESEALAAAEAMENDARVEEQWAEMAYKHAQTYERILGAFPDPRRLRLTPYATSQSRSLSLCHVAHSITRTCAAMTTISTSSSVPSSRTCASIASTRTP